MDVTSIWSKINENLGRFDNFQLQRGGMRLEDCQELEALLTPYLKSGMRLADVGCWTGASSVFFSKLVGDGSKVISIDLFKGAPTDNLSEAAKYFDVQRVWQETVDKSECKNIELHVGDSAEMAKQFPDKSFDVVFLDADHRYESIKKDIAAWSPKVKDGGILCGHDCEIIIRTLDDMHKIFKERNWSAYHYGVARAVGEVAGTKKFKDISQFTPDETLTSVIWYLKK